MISEEKSSLFEGAVAAVGVVVLFASTLSLPRLTSTMSRTELTEDRARKAQRIAVLQQSLDTAHQEAEVVRAQLASADALLEQARDAMNALTVERDELQTRVTATTKQLREVDTQLEALKKDMAEYKELVSMQEVAEERDDARRRAEKAEERIRELTLQLNRAGVWP
jgi:chromosome segregation ATPase